MRMGRLFRDFDEFVANGSEFFESGEHVIALGNYAGVREVVARSSPRGGAGRGVELLLIQPSRSPT